jgi:hypothetical protein
MKDQGDTSPSHASDADVSGAVIRRKPSRFKEFLSSLTGYDQYKKDKQRLSGSLRNLGGKVKDVGEENTSDVLHVIKNLLAYFAHPTKLSTLSDNVDKMDEIRAKTSRKKLQHMANELEALEVDHTAALLACTSEQNRRDIDETFEEKRAQIRQKYNE